VCLDFVAVSLTLRFTLLTQYQDFENIDISVADSNSYVHIAGVFRTLKHKEFLEVSKRKALGVLELPVELKTSMLKLTLQQCCKLARTT